MWCLDRNDGRKGSPTLSIDQWNFRLRQGSFSGVDLSIPDYDGPAQQMTLMVTKKISPNPCPSSVSIIFDRQYENTYFDLPRSLREVIEHRYGSVKSEDVPSKEIEDDRTYIIIDSNRDPLMTDATSSLSARILDLLQRAKKILWIVIPCHPGVSRRASKLNVRIPRIVKPENENLKLVRVEILHFEDLSNLCLKILEIMRESFYGPAEFQSKETEYIYTEESVLIPRLVPSSKLRQTIRQRKRKQIQTGCYRQEDRPLKLNLEPSSSANEDLHFIEHQFEESLAPLDIEVEVHAWGVDSHAVLAKSSSIIGEFSGRVVGAGSKVQDTYRIGDRVCCWGGNADSSFSRIDATRACHLSDSVPFSIAASIPVAFSTAYHGLVELGSLTEGQTVLIDAATESTAEAAVRIAQHIGAKIIVTADGPGSQDLAGTFALPKEFVLSRTSDIAWHVRNLTEGRGLDVIFSTIKNQSFDELCACLKPFGRYIEIRKPGGNVNRKGAVVCPGKDVIFCSVTFESLIKHRSLQVRKHMKILMSWIDDGLLKPLHYVEIKDVSEIANVYKSVQRGLATGKHVLEITKESVVKWTARRITTGKFGQNASLIVAGDLGQWGLDICRYVASRKAQYVALLTWSTRELEQLEMFENELRRLGINVRVISLRPFDQDLVRNTVFRALDDWPAVKGVIEADMLHEVCWKRVLP